MERRQAIKKLGLSFGAFISTPAAISILQSCGNQAPPWQPTFLTIDQGRMLKKLVDTMIPVTDDLPGAIIANVHVFIDKYLEEVVPIEDQPLHIDVLKWDDVDLNDVVWKENRKYFIENFDVLMSEVITSTDVDDVMDIPESGMVEFLEKYLAISDSEEDKQDDSMKEKYFNGTKPNNFSNAEKVGLMLRSIRSMAIWAYKNNENIGKNVLAYDPIPTTYVGCGDLQELSGGRAWAEG